MRQVLVYGDSLSWGIVPTTRARLPFQRRWPGVLEAGLLAEGSQIRVSEDCLNGRRTAWDDPYKPGRNGLATVARAAEMHAPLALAIVMLGTNDFQSMHPHHAWHSAQGLAAVVAAIRAAPIEPGMPVPPILIVTPPLTDNPRGPIAPKFLGAEAKSAGLAAAYREVAAATSCALFDANSITTASRVDGVHLDADQHHALGTALIPVVRQLLADPAAAVPADASDSGGGEPRR